MSAPFSPAAGEAIREAERCVINAKWHWCEERALARLARVPGLAWTPLFTEHPVIQVVTRDGRLLGRAHLHRDQDGGRPVWCAVPAATARELGRYRRLTAAARALDRAAQPEDRHSLRPGRRART